jgi:hypothetical protein
MSRGAIDVGSNIHETNDDIIRKHGVAKFLTLRTPRSPSDPASPRSRSDTQNPDRPPTIRVFLFRFVLWRDESRAREAQPECQPVFPSGNSMQLSQGPAAISFPEYGRIELRKGRASGGSATVRPRWSRQLQPGSSDRLLISSSTLSFVMLPCRT